VSWFVVTLYTLLSRAMARLGARRSITIGRALGVFAFYCIPIRRGVVLENLARAFPEKSKKERWAIARDCYRQLGRIAAEVIFLPSLPDEEIAKLVRLQNEDLLKACFAQGRGLIFCMGHMGNWEMIGFAGYHGGYDVYAVTKTLKGAINERIHAMRKAYFKELASRDSFAQGLEALRANAALALIIDQHRSGDRAVVIDFFGRPAATSPSPALFHLRSGAPVVTAWMTLGADDVYDIWVRGPYPVPEAPTMAERLQLHTQWLARDLEAFIRERPAEWYWVHRRWKVPDSTPVPRAESPLTSPAMPNLRREEAA
jgi:KDO2-lipid IV(A) lauroyltransferase